ncbi:MAG: endonuclease/exonuclease/phosphatase family protein [Steroidobacteraceae bacterium]
MASQAHVAPLILLAIAALFGGCTPRPPEASPAAGAREGLRLATWNLEWFLRPEDFHKLKASCTSREQPPPRSRPSIPCDVAYGMERSSSDIKTLADYAKRLGADVIALQEVDGPAAAALLFAPEDYDFCFTGRRHVQNNGFAVRRSVAHRCGPDLRELSLGDSVRRGKELVLFPGEPDETRLLAVHLKSGCARNAPDDHRDACRALRRQMAILERWIDTQAAAGRRFAVLGDFNRDFVHEPRRNGFWTELDDSAPPEADLSLLADHVEFRNCAPQQAFSGYIDHIILSRSLAMREIEGSFRRPTYTITDFSRRRLSDHCPVAISLSLGH